MTLYLSAPQHLLYFSLLFLDSIPLNEYNVPTDNMEVCMFEYMTVQEAAIKWNISERRIQTLCSENRIEGIVRLSRVWLIPKDAKKPAWYI